MSLGSAFLNNVEELEKQAAEKERQAEDLRRKISEQQKLAERLDSLQHELMSGESLARVLSMSGYSDKLMAVLNSNGVQCSDPILVANMFRASAASKANQSTLSVRHNNKLNEMHLSFKTHGRAKTDKVVTYYMELCGDKVLRLCRDAGGQLDDKWNSYTFGDTCDGKEFSAVDGSSHNVAYLGCNVIESGVNFYTPVRNSKYKVNTYRMKDTAIFNDTVTFMSTPQYLKGLISAARDMGFGIDELLWDNCTTYDSSNTDNPMQMFNIVPKTRSTVPSNALFEYGDTYAIWNTKLERRPTRKDINDFMVACLSILGGDDAVDRFKKEVRIHVGWSDRYQGKYVQSSVIS